MNVRIALTALAAVMAVAVLLFLLLMTQTVDNDLHLQRLESIRAVDSLDVALNRAVTQARSTSMSETDDARAVITRQLGDALNAMEQGEASLKGLSPELDAALATFLETIQDKFEIGFDFEARNVLISQRLIGGIDSIPLHAAETVAAAPPAVRERVRGLVAQLQTAIMNFGVAPAPANQPQIMALLDDLKTLAADQTDALRGAVDALRWQCEDVIADKSELVDKLTAFLDRPTGQQLREVEQAYVEWHGGQVARANVYRQILVAYAAFLLVGLALLGWRLRNSFRELDAAHSNLQRANITLEDTVEERTRDLTHALKDLRESEAQLIQSEKMASLGQMVAGVAHEINTPLGYARSNADIVRSALADLRSVCVAQGTALRILTSEDATDESVAQAVSDAHEKTAAVDPEALVAELDSLLMDADHGLVQIADLVGSLKDFSRVDRSRTDMFSVNDGIESALKICHSQLKGRVQVVKQYGRVPNIQCSPSQLNQVFLNLFTNAAQAIDGNGKIYIHTATEGSDVAIRILDTGCGMSEETRARIFEPFFTTKPVGKGTGLGLSIVFRIVEEHGGRIDVRSNVGKGSEFILRLPTRQAQPGEPEPARVAA